MFLPPWSGTSASAPYNENFNDAVTQIAPWQKAMRLAWKEGSPPFWNRWNGCGMPLGASGLAESFSPFTFLMFPFPLARGFTLLFLVKLLLAFCGMWLWLAEMRVSETAAMVGAVSFAFSLTMTGWLLFPQTSSFCLWPWALFGFEVSRDPARRLRGAVLLCCALVVWGLGHPEIAALGAILFILWVISRESQSSALQRRQVLVSTALAGIIAVGLTAFLLIPEALAITASNRARGATEFWRKLPFSLWPHGPLWKGYLTLFFPTSLGDGISMKKLAALSPGSFLEMGLGYFGLVAWAAALCFFRTGRARQPPEWILVALVVVGACVALGCWPFFELFFHLPLVGLAPPLRSLSWVSLAGAALAAFELDRLRDDLERSRRHLVPFILIFLILGLGALAVFRYLTPLYRAVGDLEAHRQAVLRTCTVLALAALVALATGLTRRARLLAPLLALVSFLELGRLGQHLYRFGSPAELFPGTPLLEFLRGQPTPFRVLGEGPYLFPDSNVFAGMEDIRTHDAVERRDYVDYLDRIAGYPPREYFKFVQDVDAPGLDRLNVKYLISRPDRVEPSQKWRLVYGDKDGRVFENMAVWPRIFFMDARTGRFDNSRLTVADYRETTNSVTFIAQVPGTTPIVAHTSLVSDGGWRARMQPGGSLPVGREEGLFLAITIPPGTHRIVLNYRPPGLFPGLAISSAVALILIATIYKRLWGSRKTLNTDEV